MPIFLFLHDYRKIRKLLTVKYSETWRIIVKEKDILNVRIRILFRLKLYTVMSDSDYTFI